VIPIQFARKNLEFSFNRQKLEAKVHAIELGFAVSGYILQTTRRRHKPMDKIIVSSKTMSQLIINPYKRCTPEIDLMSLLSDTHVFETEVMCDFCQYSQMLMRVHLNISNY